MLGEGDNRDRGCRPVTLCVLDDASGLAMTETHEFVAPEPIPMIGGRRERRESGRGGGGGRKTTTTAT